jgi:xanthine dehydrogenase molybdopterin-binding subunit B
VRDTGTFSYATHAALVAVDPEIGDIEILDYVIVEDGGKLVNPMIVDGQMQGAIVQGVEGGARGRVGRAQAGQEDALDAVKHIPG